MKYARQRWFGAAAVWLGGLIAPAAAEPIIFPEDSATLVSDDSEGAVSMGREREASISISDATGSVRMGASASASLSAGPVQQTQFAPPPAPTSNPAAVPQVARPSQPIFPEAANPYQDAGVGFAQTQPANEILWRMGRVNMDQYGFNGGYTQFNAFAPLFSDGGNAVTFINPRIGVSDYSMGIANVGVGHRRYSAGRNRVYGGSFWYDYDNGHATSFNQLGISLENIGQYYSYRGNAYFPIGDRSALSGFTDGSQTFTGNNISVLRNYTYQNAYQIYEGEFAVPMPVLGAYGFDMGVGVYFLNGQTARDATGVSARIQSQITENFWMNGLYTYDKQFDSNFSLNFEFTMPSGMPRRWFRRPSVKSYLTQSVMRRYRVAAGESHSTSPVLGRDTNGNVITIVYIDPDPAATRDLTKPRGTIENPYLSTTEYAGDAAPERYQFVFVRRGSDADEAANLNTGITLVDYIPSDPSDPGPPVYGQKLIGDVDLPVAQLPSYDVVFNGITSQFQLPSETNGTTGDKPVLSNFGGTEVVTLSGNGHEVFGMTINGATSAVDSTANASGIVTSAPTDGFYIHGNTFQNVINGIQIDSDTSVATGLNYDNYGRIVDNEFNGTSGESVQAVNINHTAGDLNLLVADNTISNFDNGATSGGVFVTADGAGANVNGVAPVGGPELGVLRNEITDSGSGIVMLADNGGTLATDVSENTVTGSTEAAGSGFSATAQNASTVQLNNFNDNVFTDGAGNGASLVATGGSTLSVLQDILNNAFNNNGVDGLNVLSDASTITVQGIGDGTVANGNTFTGNADDGLDILADNAGTFTVIDPIVNNQFNTNGDNGLVASAENGSTIGMIIGDPTTGSTLGNEFIGNGLLTPVGPASGAGINLSATGGGSQLNVPILNNTVTANVGNGIRYALDNAATEDLIYMQGNTVGSNGLNGVAISTENTDITDIVFDSNVVLGSLGGDGLDITSVDSVIDTVQVSQNGLQSNVEHGFDLNLDNSTLNTLNVVDNRGGTALAAGTLGFNYQNTTTTANVMTNTSSAGLNIGRVILNIAATGQGFRPDLTNTEEQFLPSGGTDLTTGLSAVNGNLIIAGTNPLQAADGTVITGGGVPVLGQVLDLSFTDFNTGESLNYDLAHSQLGNDTLQNGASLIGSTGTVILEDGRSVTGTFTATGLSLNQGLTAVGVGISNNGLDGVHLNATNGSAIGAINVDNNMIQSNTNHGVEIVATGASTLPTTGTPIVFNNNDIQNQITGDGVRLVNPDTGSVPVGMDFTDNRILGNAGAGVRASVNGTSGGITSNFTGNTISNNESFGVTYTGTQNATVDLNIGGPAATDRNVFDNNVDANIALSLSNDVPTTSHLLVQNNIISNARDGADPFYLGEGINIFTTGESNLETANILSNQITGNAGDGIDLLANGNSQVHTAGDRTTGGLLVTGNEITSNGGNGINVHRQGAAVVYGVIGTSADTGAYTDTSLVPGVSNLIANNGTNGISVLTEGQLDSAGDGVHLIAGQNMIAGNSHNGVDITTNGSSNTRVDLLSNIINGTYGSGGATQQNGINLVTNDVSYFGNIVGGIRGTSSLWDGNIIMNHSQNGIDLTRANTGAAISEMHVNIFGNAQQAIIASNGGDAIEMNDFSNQQTLGPNTTSAVMEINVGDPASINAPPPPYGAEVAPDVPNVAIFGNTGDALQINQSGSEILWVEVNNVLAMGSLTGAATGRYGLSFNAGDGAAADTRAVAGADTVISVNHSTFSGFGNDGMHFYFNNVIGHRNGTGTNSFVGGTLNVLVENSIIGQNETSFNGGDGVDIEVVDNGTNFVFNNNLIRNNQGDGFRMSLHAEQLTDPSSTSNNHPLILPNRDSVVDASTIYDTVTPTNTTLNGLANYQYNGIFDGAPFADTTYIDVTAGLTLTNNLVQDNQRDGVQLALGAATQLGWSASTAVTFVNDMAGLTADPNYTLDPRLQSFGHAIVNNNDMSGNNRFGFYTLTQDALSTALQGTSGPRTTYNPLNPVTSANFQRIQLDPLAHMWLDFQSNVGSVLNPTVQGGHYNNDPTKTPTSNRWVQTNFNVFLGGTGGSIDFTGPGGIPGTQTTQQTFTTQWGVWDTLLDSGNNSPTYFYYINGTAHLNNPPFGVQP